MRFCSIASGSSGNCVYVGCQNTNLLIDAGISGKRIEKGLAEIGIEPSSVNAILITHEHSDHIQGAAILARKYKIALYGTKKTLDYIYKTDGKLCSEYICPISPDNSFFVGDIEVTPFKISHDACDPVSYSLRADGKKLGVVTDLGFYDDYIIKNLTGADALYVEANHDINMLMVGSYPYSLKQRISGSKGHLSNDDCGRLVCGLQHEGLKYVVLAHLSKENNYAELAYETVRAEVLMNWKYESKPVITVANRDIPSAMIYLDCDSK